MKQEYNLPSGRLVLILAFLIYACAWYMAWTRGLNCTLEGESGMTAREFLRTGDWAVNHMNGMPDYDKPSFFYWLIALASFFTGRVNELAVRIPSLLSSAAVMWMFFLYGNKNDGETVRGTALPAMAAFIFISSPKVFWMTQMGRIDMTLTMLCFATITSFYIYWTKKIPPAGERLGYWLFFVASSLAVMVKGPVGILLTWPPVFIFLVSSKRWHEIRHFFMGWGMLLFLCLTLPWYLNACISTDWEFFRHFFLKESVSRFGNIFKGLEFKHFNHSPSGIYLVYFLTGFFPWSIVLPAAAWNFLKKKERNTRDQADGSFLGILFIYTAWIFTFFTLCGVKRSDYILPLYPAAALITAHFIIRLCTAHEGRSANLFNRSATITAWLLAATGGLAAILALTLISFDMQHILGRYLPVRISSNLHWFGDHGPACIFFVLLYLLILSLWSYMNKRIKPERCRPTAQLATMIAAVWIISAGIALPFIYYGKDLRPWCSQISGMIGKAPIYSLHFWDEECAFYLDRPMIKRVNVQEFKKLMGQKDRRIFVLLREKELKKLEKSGSKIPWLVSTGADRWRSLYLVSNRPD